MLIEKAAETKKSKKETRSTTQLASQFNLNASLYFDRQFLHRISTGFQRVTAISPQISQSELMCITVLQVRPGSMADIPAGAGGVSVHPTNKSLQRRFDRLPDFRMLFRLEALRQQNCQVIAWLFEPVEGVRNGGPGFGMAD